MKKNIFKLIIIFILIIIEALLTINLSICTADIINIGLIKKGMDLSIPFFIDEENMELIEEYIDKESELKNYYTFVSKNDVAVFQKYNIKTYKNIYMFKENTNIEIAKQKINKIILPIISTQNYHVKYKLNKLLKSKLTEEQYNTLSDAINIRNIKKINSVLNESLKEEILDILNASNYIVDDIVLEECINEYNKYEFNSLGIDIEPIKNTYIYGKLKTILLMIFAELFIQIITIRISLSITGNICENIRIKLAEKLFKIKTRNLGNINIPKISDAIINNTKIIETSLPIIIKEFIYAPVVIIYGLYLIIIKSNITVAFLILSSIILSLIVTIIGMIIVNKKSKYCKTEEAILSLKSKSILKGLPIVKSFLMEDFETIKFKRKVIDIKDKYKFVNNILCAIVPFLILIMSVSLGAIYYEGIHLVDAGKINIGSIIAIFQIAIHIITAFFGIAVLGVLLKSTLSSAKDIKKILNLPQENHNGSIVLTDLKNKEIKFNNVSLIKENKHVLDNINFTIIPGKTNAIVGKNGAGKTCILNLLLQNELYTSGSITIENTELKEYSLDSYKEQVSISTQENYIFAGTIEENLKLANPNISENEMLEIIDLIGFDDIKANGNILEYEINIGEKNLSGGQKQRIAIANAIAKKPDLLILDDSFSSLDNLSAKKIQDGIRKVLKDTTILIISQKISDIKNADNIVVIDNGKIISQGTHDYLKTNCELYRDFINIQVREDI